MQIFIFFARVDQSLESHSEKNEKLNILTAPSTLWAKSPPLCPSLRWCCFCVPLNSVHTNFNCRYLLQRLLFPLPFQNNGERKYQFKKKSLYDERPVTLDMQINTKYTLYIQEHFVKQQLLIYYIFPALKELSKIIFMQLTCSYLRIVNSSCSATHS